MCNYIATAGNYTITNRILTTSISINRNGVNFVRNRDRARCVTNCKTYIYPRSTRAFANYTRAASNPSRYYTKTTPATTPSRFVPQMRARKSLFLSLHPVAIYIDFNYISPRKLLVHIHSGIPARLVNQVWKNFPQLRRKFPLINQTSGIRRTDGERHYSDCRQTCEISFDKYKSTAITHTIFSPACMR